MGNDRSSEVLSTPAGRATGVPGTHPFERVKRIAINLFIAFHLATIACWCVPIDSPLIPLCKNLVRPYVLWMGLFQSWDTFAPIPKGVNMYIEARLLFADHSEKTWAYPRIERLSLERRLCGERYRKFADNLQRDELDGLLVDAARHIARFNSSPGHPVKTVILIQKSSFIVFRTDGNYVPEPWETHILLGYGVRPEDLP